MAPSDNELSRAITTLEAMMAARGYQREAGAALPDDPPGAPGGDDAAADAGDGRPPDFVFCKPGNQQAPPARLAIFLLHGRDDGDARKAVGVASRTFGPSWRVTTSSRTPRKGGGVKRVDIETVRQCHAWCARAGTPPMPALLVSRLGLGPNPQRKLDEARQDPPGQPAAEAAACDGEADEFAGWHTQSWLLRELAYDVTRSAYYQPHTALCPPAAAALLAGLKSGGGAELPCISTRDPVVRYHDWPAGTIVGITRDYGGFEGQEYYRRVTA